MKKRSTGISRCVSHPLRACCRSPLDLVTSELAALITRDGEGKQILTCALPPDRGRVRRTSGGRAARSTGSFRWERRMLRARPLQERPASRSHRPAAAPAQPDASSLSHAARCRLAAQHCQPYAATVSSASGEVTSTKFCMAMGESIAPARCSG